MVKMGNAKILLKEFVDSYKDSLGVEGAEQLLKQTIYKAGLNQQDEFTKEEALRICRALKQYPGFIGIIGGILNSRIIIR
jgi:hypothetical protein